MTAAEARDDQEGGGRSGDRRGDYYRGPPPERFGRRDDDRYRDSRSGPPMHDRMREPRWSDRRPMSEVELDERPPYSQRGPSRDYGRPPMRDRENGRPPMDRYGDRPAHPRYEERHRPPQDYEERRPTPSYEERRPAPAYEERHPATGYEERRPAPSYEERRPAPGYEERHSAPAYEERRPAPGYEERRPAPAYEESRAAPGYERRAPPQSTAPARYEERAPASRYESRPQAYTEDRAPGQRYPDRPPARGDDVTSGHHASERPMAPSAAAYDDPTMYDRRAAAVQQRPSTQYSGNSPASRPAAPREPTPASQAYDELRPSARDFSQGTSGARGRSPYEARAAQPSRDVPSQHEYAASQPNASSYEASSASSYGGVSKPEHPRTSHLQDYYGAGSRSSLPGQAEGNSRRSAAEPGQAFANSTGSHSTPVGRGDAEAYSQGIAKTDYKRYKVIARLIMKGVWGGGGAVHRHIFSAILR